MSEPTKEEDTELGLVLNRGEDVLLVKFTEKGYARIAALRAVVENTVSTLEGLTGEYGSSAHYFRHKTKWFVKFKKEARAALAEKGT